MEYFQTTTKLVWIQEPPSYDGIFLITLRRPDGTKYVTVAEYDTEEESFYGLGSDEFIAYACPTESEIEFWEAKEKGLAGELKWECKTHPNESGDYLVQHEWGCDDSYDVLHYVKEERHFESYTLSEIAAWTKLPDPCGTIQPAVTFFDDLVHQE